MAYTFYAGELGLQPIAVTSTTKNHSFGRIERATDPTYGAGEFIYLQGVANTVVGSFVTYNMDDGTTTLLAANAIGPVAVAMSANVASQYGWYQIQGKAIGVTAGAVADNADLYCSGTAGAVDDTVVTGDHVWIAKAASACTQAATIEVEISRPFVNDGVNGGTS